MSKIIKINQNEFRPLEKSTLEQRKLTEPYDLERWIMEYPEVIDGSVKIITHQFNRWASEHSKQADRLDILAIDNNKQIVVIELKRVSDKYVHLQALTYAALSSSFDFEVIVDEYQQWVNKESNREIDNQIAREEIIRTFDDGMEDGEELDFSNPRICLVAPDFPDQVLTTIQWLNEVAPDLVIECHQFQVYEDGDDTFVSFNRIFPVENFDERRLRAQAKGKAGAQSSSGIRRRKAVLRIQDAELIEDGALIEFDPSNLANAEDVAKVQAWLNEGGEKRQTFTWVTGTATPLKWSETGEKLWSPSGLRNEIFSRAGAQETGYAATLGWLFQNRNLAEIAEEAS